MKSFSVLVVVLFLCLTAVPGTTAAKVVKATANSSKSQIAQQVPEPTQKGVVAWADMYYNKYEPKLEGDNKDTIESIKTAFSMNKGSQLFMDDTISKLVTELTISLTANKSFDLMVCASALLVKTDPRNARVINLFGIVLNAAGKSKEALPVFEYGVSILPGNPLLRLNLANAYMDANQDEKAKPMLDKLSIESPNDQAVWRALATYWYQKKNMAMFRDCLLKAAKFKGYVAKKIDKKKEIVNANAAEGNETPEQLEPKLKELAASTPFTTADVLEEDYPTEAQQIRDKYCKLQGDEKWRLPKLPQFNSSTPADFEASKPIIEEWANVFGEKYEAWLNVKAMKMGVNPNASDKVKEAQAQKAAQDQMAEAMKNAQDMLKNMKNMPGMDSVKNKKELNDAMKELQKAAKNNGVKLPKDAPKVSADDQGDGSGDQGESFDITKMPTFDSGSPWAQINYRNYSEIQRTYGVYFSKYYKEYNAKVQDIYKVYGEKVKDENDRYAPEYAKLQIEHHKPNSSHGDKDIPCRAAELKHKQLLNAISLNYYHQWINLYMPQYAQKMKPNLDAYWDVCMIYIRSMTDPKVMEREFYNVKTTYLMYASMAGTAIGGGGFDYYPETDEEQRQLDIDIATARDEAEQKKPEFAREFQSPDFDFSKWMEDHFVVEIAGQFFALKVTAKTIQFDANALIFGGSLKYNPVDNIFESSSSIALKANIGLNICGVGAELKSKVELAKRTATWDFDKNTYVETNGASGEGKLKVGPVTAGSKWELDSQLNAKTSAKITLGDFSLQDQAKFPNK
jgi:hypothetical protein